MAKREIVVELQLSDKNAVAELGRLEIETKQYQRELKALNAEIAKNGQATRQQQEAVGTLNASIRRNQTVIRELKNDLSGATDAGLRFRDKMAEASRAGLAEFGLQAVTIAGVTAAVVNLAKETFKLAEQIEKADARNRAIAGESLPAFEEAAKRTANAIGLTEREYVSLAANQQLRLKNLGLEGKLTEELALKTVDTADALSDFSAGTLSAEQAAGLLNDALTGQTRGLKELGIPVKFLKEDVDALATKIQETEGVTREQAEALANLQLAFDQMQPYLEKFGESQLDIDKAMDLANGRMKQAREELAVGLTPAIIEATKFGAEYTKSWADFVSQGGAVRKTLATITAGFSELVAANVSGALAFFEDAEEVAPKAQEAAAAVDEVKASIEGVEVVGTRTRTLKQLREELSELKKAREELLVTDKEGLAANAASIAALEKQLKAIDASAKATENKTAKVKELTQAEKDLAAQMQASANEPVTPLQPRFTLRKPLAQEDETLAAFGINPLAAKLTQENTDEVLAVLNDYYDERARLAAETAAAEQAALDQAFGAFQNFGQGIAAIGQAQTANEVAEYEKRIEAARIAGQSTVELEAQKNEAIRAGAQQAFEIQRALTLAQIAVDTAKAISSLVAASAGNPTNAVTFGAAGAAQFAAGAIQIAANMAQAIALLSSRGPGFEEGGYTGRRRRDSEPVGVVHANEYVVPAPILRTRRGRALVDDLEKMRLGHPVRYAPPYISGGSTVRFMRGTGIAPVGVSSSDIRSADLNRALMMMPTPVVRVQEINRVQHRVNVIDSLSTA